MRNQVFTNITVPKGTAFSECAQPQADKWIDCSDLEKINRQDGYTGEYQKVVQGDYVAAFASPSFDACAALPADKVDTCKIELKFNQKQVDWLEQKIPIIAATNPPLLSAAPSVPAQKPQIKLDPSEASTSSEQPAECTSLLDCSSAFVTTNWPSLLSGLVVVFLLVLFKDNLYRLIFADDRPKRPSRRRGATMTPTSSPLSGRPVDSLPPSDLKYQVADLASELKKVHSRLNELEMSLLAIEQRPVSKPSGPFSGQRGVVPSSAASMEKPQPAAIPVAPPPLLSIDLVKQAVALSDYSLISSHYHLFLNETQESRQGKFERRRFDVLGDQSQSSSFANAEFIAISVGSQCFLIPNIQPNAADPRRTMKRHVDSNSIYRIGTGSNILKIDKLAILQQISTSLYELSELGRID